MKSIVPEYMVFTDMKAQYPDTWILVANPESEKASADIKGGYLVYKNKSREQVVKKSKDVDIDTGFKVDMLRIIYTGEIKLPQNHIVCL